MTDNNPTPERAPSQEGWMNGQQIEGLAVEIEAAANYALYDEDHEILKVEMEPTLLDRAAFAIRLLAAVRPKDAAPAPTTGGVFRMEGNTLKHERTGPAPVAQEGVTVTEEAVEAAYEFLLDMDVPVSRHLVRFALKTALATMRKDQHL